MKVSDSLELPLGAGKKKGGSVTEGRREGHTESHGEDLPPHGSAPETKNAKTDYFRLRDRAPGPEIVDFGGSKRPLPAAKPIGKGGGRQLVQ